MFLIDMFYFSIFLILERLFFILSGLLKFLFPTNSLNIFRYLRQHLRMCWQDVGIEIFFVIKATVFVSMATPLYDVGIHPLQSNFKHLRQRFWWQHHYAMLG